MESNLNENFPIQDPNLNQGQHATIQNNIPQNQISNRITNNGQMQNEQLYMPPSPTNNNDIQINANNQNINSINDNPEYMPIIPKPYTNGVNTGEPQVNPEFNNQQNNISYNQPYINQPYMNQPYMVPQYQQDNLNQMEQRNQNGCSTGLIVGIIVFFCCCCCILPFLIPVLIFITNVKD